MGRILEGLPGHADRAGLGGLVLRFRWPQYILPHDLVFLTHVHAAGPERLLLDWRPDHSDIRPGRGRWPIVLDNTLDERRAALPELSELHIIADWWLIVKVHGGGPGSGLVPGWA